MTTYGNCFGKEALCDRISHPLSYYRKKAWILKKSAGKEKNYDRTRDYADARG
jgi:DNA primase large subunit